MQPEKKWYAVYTKPRWEKKIDTALIKKGVESWCPLQKVEKQWSDRKKIIEDPLFKSYVFVRIDGTERTKVLMTDGLLNFVYYLGKPAVIKNEEVEIIKGTREKMPPSLLFRRGFQKIQNKSEPWVFMGNEGTVLRGRKSIRKTGKLGQVIG